MKVNLNELVGCFVVEVGERQAWPFVTFCDNRPTRSREVRLYIDTEFWVIPEPPPGVDRVLEFVRLASTNNLMVDRVVAGDSGLLLDFGDGQQLQIAAEPRADTTGDVWWLSDWVDS